MKLKLNFSVLFFLKSNIKLEVFLKCNSSYIVALEICFWYLKVEHFGGALTGGKRARNVFHKIVVFYHNKIQSKI